MRGTESGTIGDDQASNRQAADDERQALPPDLAALVNAWPTLDPALKAGILAMIRAAKVGA